MRCSVSFNQRLWDATDPSQATSLSFRRSWLWGSGVGFGFYSSEIWGLVQGLGFDVLNLATKKASLLADPGLLSESKQ